MVLAPTLRSAMHLELMSVYGVKWQSNLILFCMWIPAVLASSVEKTALSPLSCLSSSGKPVDHKMEGLF